MTSLSLPLPRSTAILGTNLMDAPKCIVRDIGSAPHTMSATRHILSIVVVGGLFSLFTVTACCAVNEKTHQREIGSTTTPRTKPARPHLVGRYSHAGLIVFEGNKTYSAALLRRGLLASTDFLLAAYPAEEFDPFLKTMQDCLQRGYTNRGFPDARVTVDYDTALDVVKATIEEGPRFRWGTLKIEGLKVLDATAFTQEFLQTAEKSDSFARRISEAVNTKEPGSSLLTESDDDPLSVKNLVGDKVVINHVNHSSAWKAGDTASFGAAADKSLEQQIIQALRWKGVSAAKVTISHQQHADTGLADTRVIVEEGPPVVLHTITLKGHEVFTREGLLNFLGLHEGMIISDDIIARVEDRLARSMRFLRWRGLLVDAKDGIDLCLGIQEMPGALPLEQPLNADQQEFVKLAEWLTLMDKRDTTLEARTFLADGTPDPNSPFRFTWAAQNGLQLQLSRNTPEDSFKSFILAMGHGGIKALLDESNKRSVWHAAVPNAIMEMKLSLVTQLNDKGQTAGAILYSGGIRNSSGAGSGLKLQASVTPTEFYRISTRPDSIVRRISDQGVECLEILYQDVRILWDIPEQQLREWSFPLDDASKGKSRRFIKIRQGMEQWRAIDTMLVREEKSQDLPWSSFSDWSRLLLKIPDLESKTEGLLTRDLIERYALFLDLSSHFMISFFDAWQKGSNSKDSFTIPMRVQDSNVPPPISSLLAELWFMFADQFLPPDSWLWELGREAFYAEMGRTQNTQAAIERIAKDPDIGPYGALLAETILKKLNLPQAAMFRRLAAQKLSMGQFRKDWEFLFRSPLGLQESFNHLFTKLAALDDRQIHLLGGPALEKPLAEAVTRLRTKPGTPPADLLWPVAQYWWSTSGEADLKAQIGPVSLLLPPDPALVAARVNHTDIPRTEVQENARMQEEFIRRSLMDRPAEMEVQLALLRERTLDELIQKVLILDAFEKNGGTLKDEFIEQDLRTFVTQHFGGDLAAFHKSLAADGLTVERFKKMRRETMIVQYVRAQVIASVKEPANSELRAFYDQQVVKKAAREVHLHAITLPKEDSNSKAQNPRQLAAEIRAKALQGADFEQLAKTYSQDDNAKNGGCRGTIDPAELYKPLHDALLTMKARDVSQVIEIESAFVLLWIKDEKLKAAPPFEKERPRLLKEVLRHNQDAFFKRWIDEKRQSALIEIFQSP